jgi:Domain of unknown function (DUF4396)
MEHAHHASLNRTAWSATLHCLTGCAIGEVLGMVIGTALGWSNAPTIVLAVVLAFFFGYALTLIPLRKAVGLRSALRMALAADTASITVMEIVDNAIMLVIPGAMDAGLASLLFWASLAFSLAVAAVAAFPVNRWLIARGRGHAVVHRHHGH